MMKPNLEYLTHVIIGHYEQFFPRNAITNTGLNSKLML